MTLYEFNQAGYAAVPKMTKADIERAEVLLSNYLLNQQAQYYMLLNNDLRYYTLFHTCGLSKNYTRSAKEIIDLVTELGTLKAIELNDNNAIEFWITHDEECHMYVLFNYDRGVVRI